MRKSNLRNYNPENNTRKCNRCKQWLDLSNFNQFKKKGYINIQYRCLCKQCDHDSLKEFAKSGTKYITPEHIMKKRANDPRKSMWYMAQRRSRIKGLEFTISLTDIVIPTLCPLLNIPLLANTSYVSGIKGTTDGSPSIDRLDNNKGYTPDNIWVISYKANAIKNNANIEQLETLITNLKLVLKNKENATTRSEHKRSPDEVI